MPFSAQAGAATAFSLLVRYRGNRSRRGLSSRTRVEEPGRQGTCRGWKNRGGRIAALRPACLCRVVKMPWKPLFARPLNRPKAIAKSNYRVNAYFLATSRERQPRPAHCQEPQELENAPAGGITTLITHFFVISRAPVPAERPHRHPAEGAFRAFSASFFWGADRLGLFRPSHF